MQAAWPPPLVDVIPRIISLAEGAEAYLVGGAVRDTLLGRTTHDFDFVVDGDSIGLAKQLARALRADFYVLDNAFGAARVILPEISGRRDFLDFGRMRGSEIQADLEARDFTINAIALNIRDGQTLDPLRGVADLRAKQIRLCTAQALEDDAARVLRAVRLAAALEFRIESHTRRALRAAAHLVSAVSPERNRDELFRMLDGPRTDACLRALEMLGVLEHLLPELSALKGIRQSTPHVHDAWNHTLSVMRHLGAILDLVLEGKVEEANGLRASLLTLGLGRYRQEWAARFANPINQARSVRALLQFAALYHESGKAVTASMSDDGAVRFIGQEEESARLATERGSLFNLGNGELEWIRMIVVNHLRFGFLATSTEQGEVPPSRLAVHRYFKDVRPVGAELVLLGLADLEGTREHALTDQTWSAWIRVARVLVEELWERPEQAVAPNSILDGNDLMHEMGLAPGPALGQVLEALREAQAVGDVTSRNTALQFAKDWLRQNGSSSEA